MEYPLIEKKNKKNINEKIAKLRTDLDKAILDMRKVLKIIAPAILGTLVMIGVVIILQILMSVIFPFSILSLYQKDLGQIGKETLETRFYIGLGIYLFFWILTIIIISYAIFKIKNSFFKVKPQLKDLSKEIVNIKEETSDLTEDIKSATSIILDNLSRPEAAQAIKERRKLK